LWQQSLNNNIDAIKSSRKVWRDGEPKQAIVRLEDAAIVLLLLRRCLWCFVVQMSPSPMLFHIPKREL